MSDSLKVLVTTPRDKYHDVLKHPNFWASREDVSHLYDMVPPWVFDIEGNIFTISPIDFEDVPDEVKEHLEILKH